MIVVGDASSDSISEILNRFNVRLVTIDSSAVFPLHISKSPSIVYGFVIMLLPVHEMSVGSSGISSCLVVRSALLRRCGRGMASGT